MGFNAIFYSPGLVCVVGLLIAGFIVVIVSAVVSGGTALCGNALDFRGSPAVLCGNLVLL